MSKIYAFNGVMPTPCKVKEVAAVPYDVVNTEEAAELAKGLPLSFLHVSRPEIDLAPGVDLHADEVYAKAASNYIDLKKKAPLVADPEARLYVYSLKMGNHVQTGIVAAASVDDYDNNIIKKHEKTRKDKEDDRARHVMTLRSQTGPVFLTYRDTKQVDDLIDLVMEDEPEFDFTAVDGVCHKLWKTDAATSKKLAALFESIPYLYIADGHHRAASASRARAALRAANPKHTGNEEYNRFLAVIFPATQLRIMPYNRVVHDLNGRGPEDFLKAIREKFSISPTDNPVPDKGGVICMLFKDHWFRLRLKADTHDLSVTDALDVSVLQNNLLGPILGVDDPRTSKKIDFVGGIRGVKELEKLVAARPGSVAFSMFPTTLNQLMDIADHDQIMPPKSTWFEPKLRDGLVCHDF